MNNIGYIIILTGPFFLGFLSWIFLKKCRMNTVIKIVIVILTVLLIDFFIRSSSNGAMDFEGNGWLQLFSLSCYITSLIAILIYGFSPRYFKETFVGIIISIAISFLYYNGFKTYGLKWEEFTNNDINESKKNNCFVSLITFDSNELIYKTDTIRIQTGWIEKSIFIDNSGIIKKKNILDKYNAIIRLKINSPTKNIYYEINNRDTSVSELFEDKISFRINDLKDTNLIYFYKLEADTLQKFKLLKKIKMVATPIHN